MAILSTTVIIISALVGLAALVAKFWSWIRDTLFQKAIRPLVRKLLGEKAEDRLVNFMVWLDDKVCLTRRVAKMLWDYFKKTVLKLKTRYMSIDGETAEKVTTIEIQNEDGSIEKRQLSETVEYEEIPSKAREEMMRANTKTAELDDREVIEEKFKIRWQQSGYEPLELEA